MIEGLKPYSEYKESGSKWLGAVPAKWEVRNLRTLISKQAERDRPDLPLLSVAREKGVFVRSMTDADENHNVIPDDLTNYKVARAGNLVINKMKAWQGSMGIAPCDGIVSPAYFVFDFRIANHAFGQRLLRSKPYVAHFGQASDGVRVGQWDLSIPGMRQIPVLVPSDDEQAAIVRFLDWANGRLERAISAKHKVIALLNEQKQAIIHRAVTRGLDPAAPLKPSGIPWLGEIPQHWEVLPLKRIAWFKSGAGFPVHEQGGSGWELPFLKVSDMTKPGNERWIEFINNSVTRETAQRLGAYIFPANSIIFPKVGGAMLTNKRRILRRPSCIDNNVMGCVVAQGDLDFVFVMLEQLDLGRLSKPGPVPAIGEGEVREIKVAVPPETEQKAVVHFIQEETVGLATAIARLEREIDLLREYRTRLVADVVTGKLDVREAAARLPEETPLDITADDADLFAQGEQDEQEATA